VDRVGRPQSAPAVKPEIIPDAPPPKLVIFI